MKQKDKEKRLLNEKLNQQEAEFEKDKKELKLEAEKIKEDLKKK